MKPITKSKKNSIVSLLKKGMSCREIAEKLNVGKSTVSRIRKSDDCLASVSKGGRPKKFTSRDKVYCVHQITKGRKSGAVAVKKCLLGEHGVDVDPNTVRRSLRESGIKSKSKPKKPLLRAENRKKRLKWAKEHRHWTVEDWKRVVWSDETKVERLGSGENHYTWIRDGVNLQPHNVKQTVKNGGGYIMVWSCVTSNGVGYIHNVVGNMDSQQYCNILEGAFIKTLRYYKMKQKDIIFMHDNDPKHVSQYTKAYLIKKPYVVMEWPPQSPDLNPIENLWRVLKLKLFHEYEVPPNGILELWERTYKSWYSISKDEVLKYYESMPKRCEDIIKANGYWIDY